MAKENLPPPPRVEVRFKWLVKLPKISGELLINLLEKSGFKLVGRKGRHASLQKDNCKIIIPLYYELSSGVQPAILKQCGLPEEMINLLS